MNEQDIGPIRDAYAGKLAPDLQVHTFRNLDQAFPTRIISRHHGSTSAPVQAFTRRSDNALQDFSFESGGKVYDRFDVLSQNRVAGLLVLKDGEIVCEDYELGCTDQTRWMSMSMAKSISTTLVGAAIHDGSIASIDDQLSHYIPELQGGAYEAVTVRQLLLMTSGAQWDETHTNVNSERRHVLELQIAQQPDAILRYMSELPRLAEPGRRWNYSTGETHLVGALLKAATGRWVADYLSEKIWSTLGMESDATWWLETPDGLEIAGSGINATLRDYARFGQFVMNGGITPEGQRVLPENWLKDAGGPTRIDGELVPYGYMWWSLPSADGSFDDGAFCARGIFGQRLYINPRQRTVMVMWSARSKPMGAEIICDNDFFNAVVEVLR